jgi:hypothetical protein
MRTVFAWTAALLGALLVLPVLLVMLPLWAVSACTRVLARLLEPNYLTRDQLIEFDPTVGWRPRANLKTHHLLVDVFRIATDSEGWRGRWSLSDSDVVVFGDSFAAGYGVDDEHIFANLSSEPRIKPIGIGGYSMVQAFLWMKELAPSLSGKLVVWFIYLGNDLYDNLSPDLRGYRKPFLREVRGGGGWEICSDHVTREQWPIVRRPRKGHIHMGSLAELCSDTFLAERAFEACRFLISEGHRLCSRVGADLVVLTIPDTHQLSGAGQAYLKSLGPNLKGFDADLPDAKIASMCHTDGVRFIPGRSFLDVGCYKQNDCHWNVLGHRRVAKTLADLYASSRRRDASPQEVSDRPGVPRELPGFVKSAV